MLLKQTADFRESRRRLSANARTSDPSCMLRIVFMVLAASQQSTSHSIIRSVSVLQTINCYHRYFYGS